MKQKIGIILVACFSFALCLSLSACSFTDKSLYVGTWEMQSSTDETFDADTMELMQTLGVKVTLSLSDDDTGVLNYLGNDPHSATWKASSNTEGELVVDGETSSLSLNEGTLTVTAANGATMTFSKVSDEPAAAPAATSASAASASASAAAAGTTTTTGADSATETGAADATASAEAQATTTVDGQNAETTAEGDVAIEGEDAVATTDDAESVEGGVDELPAEEAEAA